jgi:two-component system alkaline phosphatase synthesis response regulator PhoP
MPQRILLVEDEAGLRITLTDRLRAEGYEIESEADGEGGLRRAMADEFDVILLDVMLPGKSGFDVCRDLRQNGVQTPVLMLTARGQTVDKVLGLKIGADDYLTKPFEMLELLARVEVLLRRPAAASRTSLQRKHFGNVTVDFVRTEVDKAGQPVSLSAKEFQLLRYFLEHPQETLSRERLLHEVWDYEATPTTRTVDVHVSWLRQKLEEDPKRPRWIVTVHGMGYKFQG